MDRFAEDVLQRWEERPFVWCATSALSETLAPPEGKTVLALAPHPDDPESAAITLRLLQTRKNDIFYAILCLSPRGVEDEYMFERGLSNSLSAKGDARKAEQMRAAKAFGPEPGRLTFLDFDEGDSLDSPENSRKLAKHLLDIEPDIVVLPVGRDTNKTHQWVYHSLRSIAPEIARHTGKPIVALYNEDPKTLDIRDDLFVLFSEAEAEWKRGLLTIHDTQQQRNIRNRGVGFDERIIEVNRRGQERLNSPKASMDYAEVFEIEIFNGGNDS